MIKQNIGEAVGLAKEWLLQSGIQNIGEDKTTTGGFHSWYDGQGGYPYVYSEITGYATTTLLHLNNLEVGKILVDRAELAAGWLMNQATHPCGGVRTRYFYKNPPEGYDWKNGIIYAFDTGMVLFGIANLCSETGKREYLDYAKSLADFLLGMQKDDGSFYAYYDPRTKEKVDIPDKWSTQSGAYHAKLALGLLKLSEIAEDNRYRESARKVCEYALGFQQPDGRFITFRKEGDTHMHPHCYTGEGLLFASERLNEPRFEQAVKKAAEWSIGEQLPSGGTPSMYYRDSGAGQWERTDELAQVLRLGLLTLDDSYQDKLSKLADRLLSFQDQSAEPAKCGGFKYGFGEEGRKFDHTNSWCTMFALQALQMYDQKINKGQKLRVEYLI